MTADSPLLLERDGAVASISFNRPSALNAIDPPMARAFLSAVRELAADRSVRAVIMRGNGNGFMAGGDLAVLSANPRRGATELGFLECVGRKLSAQASDCSAIKRRAGAAEQAG